MGDAHFFVDCGRKLVDELLVWLLRSRCLLLTGSLLSSLALIDDLRFHALQVGLCVLHEDAELLLLLLQSLDHQLESLLLALALLGLLLSFLAAGLLADPLELMLVLTNTARSGKVHREQHLCSSLTLLAVLVNTSINTEFANQIIPKFLQTFNEGMTLLNSES